MESDYEKYNSLPEHIRLLVDYLIHVDFEYKKIKDNSVASSFYADYWYFRQWLTNELNRKPVGKAVNESNHFSNWFKIKLKVDGESLRNMQDSENYEPKIRNGKITMVKNG